MNSIDTTAIPVARMPDRSRLWVFAAPRPLSAEEAGILGERVADFVSRWHAHGHPVVGGWGWEHDRFLLIAADEEATGVSGCSLDSMYDALKALERELDVTLLDASSRVWYRDAAGEIHAVTRPEFRALARGGEVGPDTLVFDNTVPTLAALRAGGWERRMAESWHGKAFL